VNYVPVLGVNGDDPKVLASVDKALTEKKITYKAGEGGKILVDEKYKDEAQLAIAMVPGLTSSVTFEDSWNRIKMSSTESDKKQLWKDFMTNSLIAKLKKFENIEDADVNMAMPEKSNYFGGTNQEKTTAFVRVKLKSEISPEQVQGIVSVVAASVEGLDPKDVKVVDNKFNPLNTDSGDTELERTSTQYKMRLKVKNELENNVKKLYQGNSDNFDYINVVANPVLDFDKEKSLEKVVKSPTGMEDAIVSSSETKEEVQNGSQGATPGTDTNPGVNAPGYPTTDGTNSSYKKSTTTTNKVFTTEEKEKEKAIGKPIFNESSMTVTLWYGQRVTDEAKMSPQFIEQFRNDVSSATGIPTEKISVNKYKLAAEVVPEKKIAEYVKEIIDAYGLFVLLFLMAIGFMFALPKRKEIEEQARLAAEAAYAPLIEEEKLPEIILDDKSEVFKQIENFVKEKPESVAQLLRNWIADEWD
jgi:flagellar M-ring protein FliF